jgi:two-component system, NarL family, nitrate/nitrite response regulator NarL
MRAGDVAPRWMGFDMITVAAVDDHIIVLQGLTVLLADSPGITVAAVARSVAEILDGPGRTADVVLLDLDLGAGTSAPENIRRLIGEGMKVVVLSASATPDAVREAVMAGACGYVTKGDDVQELIHAIEAAASDGTWVSPQLAFALLADTSEDRPALSGQETEALRLYAAGMPLKSVARQMGVSKDTAKQYVDRVRVKYRRAGREAGTKVDLYQRAVEDGHLPGQATPTQR